MIDLLYGDRIKDWVERKIEKKWRSALWGVVGMYLFVIGVMGAVAALGEGGSNASPRWAVGVIILLGGYGMWLGRNAYKEWK